MAERQGRSSVERRTRQTDRAAPAGLPMATDREMILIRLRIRLDAAHSGTACEPSSTEAVTASGARSAEGRSLRSAVMSQVANGAVNGDTVRSSKSAAKVCRNITRTIAASAKETPIRYCHRNHRHRRSAPHNHVVSSGTP